MKINIIIFIFLFIIINKISTQELFRIIEDTPAWLVKNDSFFLICLI